MRVARQLWLDVARARQYLYDTLPPDPRDPSADRLGASPTGPDDDQGWERWIDAYSELTSVLVGPHGDSGFGVSEARSAAQVRRSAPDETLQSVQSRSTHGEAAPAAAAPADAAPADAAPAAAAPGAAPSTAGAPSTGVLLAKRVALAGLAVLAVRGLRAPRHGR